MECFPGGSDGKSVCLQCRRLGFNPWVRKLPWRRKWQSTLVFMPGGSNGQRSLAGYSPWGLKSRTWLATKPPPKELKGKSVALFIGMILIERSCSWGVHFHEVPASWISWLGHLVYSDKCLWWNFLMFLQEDWVLIYNLELGPLGKCKETKQKLLEHDKTKWL